MKCPVCNLRDYCPDCEQANAIRQRGKCIACLILENADFEKDEFINEASRKCFKEHNHDNTTKALQVLIATHNIKENDTKTNGTS